MKRLLLLIFLAGPLLSPAQEPDNTPMRYDFHAASEYTQQSDSLLITTHQGRRLFFDTDGNSYIPRKAFIEKYGRENFRQLVDFENERIRAKRQEEERLELEQTKKLAIRKIEKLDIYESLSEVRNEYYEILDALDGEVDGAIDYPKAAQFFRDHFAGIDANGNISTTTVIGCPNLSKTTYTSRPTPGLSTASIRANPSSSSTTRRPAQSSPKVICATSPCMHRLASNTVSAPGYSSESTSRRSGPASS